MTDSSDNSKNTAVLLATVGILGLAGLALVLASRSRQDPERRVGRLFGQCERSVRNLDDRLREAERALAS